LGHVNICLFLGLVLVTLLRAVWYLHTVSARRRTEPRAPTLGDVAREAGVSPSTAARALGRYGSVSPEARARTEAAASRVGYRRNRLASSMITGRTHTLAFVAADIGNVFFAQALRGAADVAHEAGLEVVIANSDEDVALERAAVRILDEKRVDGFIIAPVGDGVSDHIAGLLARGTPVVFFDRIVPDIETDAVLIDNLQAARSGVQWLSRLGHQRIGLVTTGLAARDPVARLERIALDPRSASTTDARSAGYLAALRAAGLPVDPGLIVDAAYSREETAAAVARLLRSASRPTALFTVDNVMTLGTYEAIQKSGLRFPQDISLLGFDDLEWTTIVRPTLSVIAQPAYDLGATAARRLLDRLGGDAMPPQISLLAATLIERDSVCAPG
jgi:LacI family transcriptional regulator